MGTEVFLKLMSYFAQVELLSLPSKRCGLFSPTGLSNLIARSDSNGEDLEAFAGAGDSLPQPCCFQQPSFGRPREWMIMSAICTAANGYGIARLHEKKSKQLKAMGWEIRYSCLLKPP